jgi:hypothetical protein
MGKAGIGVLAAAVAWLTVSGVAAKPSDPVAIRLGPAVSMEPGAVRITTLVEPDERNRELVIEVESALHFRSSTVQLDGEQAARSHALWVKNLPAGQYEVRVRLQREAEREHVINQNFQVVGGRGDLRSPSERQ